MREGTDCNGKTNSEMRRLPTKMAKPGWTFSLKRIKIPTMDVSKARDGFNTIYCLAQTQIVPEGRQHQWLCYKERRLARTSWFEATYNPSLQQRFSPDYRIIIAQQEFVPRQPCQVWR